MVFTERGPERREKVEAANVDVVGREQLWPRIVRYGPAAIEYAGLDALNAGAVPDVGIGRQELSSEDPDGSRHKARRDVVAHVWEDGHSDSCRRALQPNEDAATEAEGHEQTDYRRQQDSSPPNGSSSPRQTQLSGDSNCSDVEPGMPGGFQGFL